METFTFIPVWVIQDALVLIMAMIAVAFIVKNEEHPVPILLEFAAFVFLYAAIYENFATLMGWYGYGRSLVMVFNVPITVPVIEFLVVYTTLRWLKYTTTPTWSKPFIVGFMGMLFDFTLDPLAMKQIYTTAEATIGRWTWFPGPQDAQILGEPVYNFPGWVLLSGYAAIFILLGRWWFKRSNYKPLIAYLYPILAMIAALLTLVSPLSQLLLWLGPIFTKGSFAEWIMLGIWFVVPSVLLLIYGRTLKEPLSLKKEYLLPIIFTGSHAINLLFTFIGGYVEILPVVGSAVLIQSLVLYGTWWSSRKKGTDIKTSEHPGLPTNARLARFVGFGKNDKR